MLSCLIKILVKKLVIREFSVYDQLLNRHFLILIIYLMTRSVIELITQFK